MRLNGRFANLSGIAVIAIAVFALSSALAGAQNNYLYAVGNANFSVNIPIEDGYINIANGNVHLEIPLATQAQRGNLKLDERLVYDSRIWMIVQYDHDYWWPTNVPNSSDGWRFVQGNETGSIGQNEVYYTTDNCPGVDGNYEEQFVYTWTDPSGAVHSFDPVWTEYAWAGICTQPSAPEAWSGWADDSSGYQILLSGNNQSDPNVQILDKNGTQVYPAVADRFGNQWSSDSNGNLIDDLGRTPVETSTSGNQTYYDVLTAGGARSRYTVTMETLSVQTAFNEQAVGEWIGTLSAIESIQLPDGSAYSFTYDGYGEMTSMTLPTGGVVSLGYSNYQDSYQNENRWLSFYAGGHGQFTFAPSVVTQCSGPQETGCVEQMTATDGSGNDTVYTLTLNNGAWNTNAITYQGPAANGDALVSDAATYNFQNTCPANVCVGSEYITKQTDVTTLDDVSYSKQTVYAIDQDLGSVTSLKQWDYYAGSPPSAPALDNEYTYDGYTVDYGSGYTTDGYDLGAVQVLDGNGNQVSLTNYNFNTTATATSGIVGHGAPPTGQSGPYLASVSQWINTGSSLTTNFTNDDTGSQLTSTSPNGQTSFSRDATDTYITTETPPTPSSGVSQPQSATYDASTGLPLTTTDANGEQTSYSYDWARRPTQINYPDGGQESFTYSPTQTGDDHTMSASASASRQTLVDSYGRLSRVAVYNGQGTNPWYQTDYCYDANARLEFKSYPYQCAGFGQAAVCSGAGDAYSYDALGRITRVLHGDGTSVNYQYTGRATETTDENGVQKIVQVDGLGRTTAVCEISSNGSMPGSGTPASCGLDIAGTGFLTTYAYDPPDLPIDTVTVTQGAQTRVFTTDSLGRTISVEEPESATTNYSYAYNGTGLAVTRTRPQANQTNPSTLTTTTTQYDALGRVVGVSYSDGTPTKSFAYDQSSIWGIGTISTGAAIGRLTAASSTDAEAFVYDPMGRVVETLQCLPGWCGQSAYDKYTQYSYDWMGNMLTSTDGAWVTASYTYSPAGEVQSITSAYNDGTHPPALVSNVQNGPDGPISYQLGNGLSVYRAYDSLGRVQGKWVCTGAASEGCGGSADTDFGYWVNWRGAQVSYTDTEEPSGEPILDYGYDEFNRLTSMTDNGTGQQLYNYVYDRYGNRWQQNPQQGGNSSQLSFNSATNQINSNGYAYDAAGNLTSDGIHSYTYDAEGNLTQVDGGETATYTYDALNRRATIDVGGNSEGYVYNLNAQRVSIWDMNAGYEFQGQAYWGSAPLEFYSDDIATFQHEDWLGDDRVYTSYNGSVEYQFGNLPFGDGSGAAGWSAEPWVFAGVDKDYYSSDSGTDHAQFRQYEDIQGRWMSPDPYSGSYDFTNPQSFNRYSYVLNNPLAFSDPSGLVTEGPGAYCGDNCGGDGGGGGGWLSDILHIIDSLFGGGNPTFLGSVKPRPDDPNWDGNFGESLGIPTSIPQGNWGIGMALGLPSEGCEFGPCGGGLGFGPEDQAPSNQWQLPVLPLPLAFLGTIGGDASNSPNGSSEAAREEAYCEAVNSRALLGGCLYVCSSTSGGAEGAVLFNHRSQIRPACYPGAADSYQRYVCPSRVTASFPPAGAFGEVNVVSCIQTY